MSSDVDACRLYRLTLFNFSALLTTTTCTPTFMYCMYVPFCSSFLHHPPSQSRSCLKCPLKQLLQSVLSHVATWSLVGILKWFYKPISVVLLCPMPVSLCLPAAFGNIIFVRKYTIHTYKYLSMFVCLYVCIFSHFICSWQEIIFRFCSSSAANG